MTNKTALESERFYLAKLEDSLRRIDGYLQAAKRKARQRPQNEDFFVKFERTLAGHRSTMSEIIRVKNVIAELEREAAKPSLIARIFGGLK